MGVAIINSYLVLLFLLVHFNVVRFNLFWKLSPFLVLLLTLFGLLIPMNWGAPQGSAIVVRNAVAIVPDVAGEVTEVPVTANTPLKAGDVLFKIDPTPYDAQVKAIKAQLKLSTTRLAQMTQLFERDSGRGFDVEQRQSEVDQLAAQLEGAQWNLDKTVVQAPAEGYVTNLALRKGARVANLPLAPVMASSKTRCTRSLENAVVAVKMPSAGSPTRTGVSARNAMRWGSSTCRLVFRAKRNRSRHLPGCMSAAWRAYSADSWS